MTLHKFVIIDDTSCFNKSKLWNNKKIICSYDDFIKTLIELSNYGYFGYYLKFSDGQIHIRDIDYENYR